MDLVAAKKENATGGANFYAVRDIAAAVAHEFPGVKIQALAVSTHACNPHRNLIYMDLFDRLLVITVQRCQSATKAPGVCGQRDRPDRGPRTFSRRSLLACQGKRGVPGAVQRLVSARKDFVHLERNR